MGVCEDTVCLLTEQKRLKDEYKDPDVLPKVKKADMAGMMESIEEYLRSHHGLIRETLAFVIRKTIIVQTYGDYPKYEMITRMLHLPPHKNRLHNEQGAQSVKEHTANMR